MKSGRMARRLHRRHEAAARSVLFRWRQIKINKIVEMKFR